MSVFLLYHVSVNNFCVCFIPLLKTHKNALAAGLRRGPLESVYRSHRLPSWIKGRYVKEEVGWEGKDCDGKEGKRKEREMNIKL